MANEGFKRKLAAILSADVESSQRFFLIIRNPHLAPRSQHPASDIQSNHCNIETQFLY